MRLGEKRESVTENSNYDVHGEKDFQRVYTYMKEEK